MTPLQLFSDELETLTARAAPAVAAVEQGRGHGTGIVLDGEGHVLTNAHVVARSSRLKVRFEDGTVSEGKVAGTDPVSDLAVLRTDRRGAPHLVLAEAETVRVGQVVIAMGHPYGFERSVSLGVVSALERRLPGRDGATLDGLIQTDTAINPGNSGGPLLNVHGRVVGINTAMLPWAQGIGFAVPSWTAAWVSALLIRHGAVRRRILGVAARNELLTPDVADRMGQRRGVRLMEVGRRTPASAAGLEADDVVLRVDDSPVTSTDELQRLLALGDGDVKVTVWRRGAPLARPVSPQRRAA